MALTSLIPSNIDVLSKYNALVRESLGSESIYIRAKETIEDLVSSGAIDDAQKAEIISSVIGGAVNGITSSSMSAALEWAKYEVEIEFKKLEMDQQLAILAQDLLLKEAQKDQIDSQTRLAKIESKRVFGTGVFDGVTGALVSLADEGKVWTDMQLVEQQTTNAAIEETLLGSKIKESSVAIHRIIADTYTNFGSFTYALATGDNGITSITRNDGHVSLSDTQQGIATEQGKGYSMNAWANALTGSASMLGTAIASGDFSFDAGSNELKLFDAVVKCAESLSAANTLTDEAIPVV